MTNVYNIMIVNVKELHGKAKRFGNLIKLYNEHEENAYKTYINAFCELVSLGDYQFNIKITLRSKQCISCNRVIRAKRVKQDNILECSHYICSANCMKELLIRTWKEQEFELGIALCLAQNCYSPLPQSTIISFFQPKIYKSPDHQIECRVRLTK